MVTIAPTTPAASGPAGTPGPGSLERDAVARARASAAAGRVVAEADVDAWIDGLGTATERQPPRPAR